MNREQGIKFLLETEKIAHTMKEIFQEKKGKKHSLLSGKFPNTAWNFKALMKF